MPLSRIQIDILGLLASQRDPESYVAGAAMKDAATLEDAGYQVPSNSEITAALFERAAQERANR